MRGPKTRVAARAVRLRRKAFGAAFTGAAFAPRTPALGGATVEGVSKDLRTRELPGEGSILSKRGPNPDAMRLAYGGDRRARCRGGSSAVHG